MKTAMINICGEFGDRHWVSDILLTTLVKLSQELQKLDVKVVYLRNLLKPEVKLVLLDILANSSKPSLTPSQRSCLATHFNCYFTNDPHFKGLNDLFGLRNQELKTQEQRREQSRNLCGND